LSKKCVASSCGAPNPSSRDTCYYCGGPLEEVKKAPPLKVILLVAFILIVIIAGAALKPIIARSRVPDTGPIKVSASDLCADYWENELAAQDKYEITGGYGVIVTGRVIRVVENKGWWEVYTQSVFIDGGNGMQVRCDFVSNNALKKLKAGQKVGIWGYCCGFDYMQGNVVVIEDCRL
jgi:hypothetical protein